MRARRGSVAVEFAFSAPVMMTILAGVIEWGWYVQREVAVIQAARDGALAGSVELDADDAEPYGVTRAEAALESAGFDPDDAEVEADVSSDATGDVLTVSVELVYDPMLDLLPTPDMLRAESTFRLLDD